MILIDGPYVSDYLKNTIYKNAFHVVKTKAAVQFLDAERTNFVEETEATWILREDPKHPLYTNSENALGWLYERVPELARVQAANDVKDKVLFRERLKQIHPETWFSGHDLLGLKELNPEDLPFPVILKPSVGFFSLGVQRVETPDQWRQAMMNLDTAIQNNEGLYPQGVLDQEHYVLESVIPGEEYAVDCYFNSQGEAVVLNIMAHLFASEKHMNDRVYYTSSTLMTSKLKAIQNYLNQLGSIFFLRDFPAHIELRIDGDQIQAIEINPLRFGGWCSTADTAQYAWGLNLYEMVQSGTEPNWPELIDQHQGQIHALLVLDNGSGIPGADIKAFDYDKLLSSVDEPLELRRTDFRKFPLFGFLMCRLKEGELGKLDHLLNSDLQEFIKV